MVAVQGRLISQPAKGADLRSCLDRVHWDLTDTHGWLLGWCPPGLWSGRMRWVASLSLSCLVLGKALERLLRGWWVRQGFPVDTECTAVRDYGFLVGLGNPARALLCAVWLWDVAGVVWLHCWCGLSAEQVWSPARWLTEGTVNFLMIPQYLFGQENVTWLTM